MNEKGVNEVLKVLAEINGEFRENTTEKRVPKLSLDMGSKLETPVKVNQPIPEMFMTFKKEQTNEKLTSHFHKTSEPKVINLKSLRED